MTNTEISNANDIRLGSTLISAMYIGDSLMWQNSTPVLLPYDAEIEYLAANGSTLYIDTGYIPQGQNISYEFKFRLNKFNDSNLWTSLFTAYTSEDHSTFRIIRYSNDPNNLLICCGQKAGGLGITSTVSLETDHIIRANALNVTIDNGSSIALLNIGSISLNTNPIKLFSANSARSIDLYIYYLKVWNNNNLVLNLIPVRVGLTGYMYDRISGQLFGNSGTGSFTLGPDKQ